MLCDGEEDDNILFDMEEEYDIHSSQIIPILEYFDILSHLKIVRFYFQT
jgi:hypothetical protein